MAFWYAAPLIMWKKKHERIEAVFYSFLRCRVKSKPSPYTDWPGPASALCCGDVSVLIAVLVGNQAVTIKILLPLSSR